MCFCSRVVVFEVWGDRKLFYRGFGDFSVQRFPVQSGQQPTVPHKAFST